MSAIIYPVVVAWTWGGGWLYDMGYIDFAGSSVVHLAGGTASAIIAILVGPRLGRFEVEAIPKTLRTVDSKKTIELKNKN